MAEPLTTKQFAYHSAKAFANSFSADSVYFYIGKPNSWDDPLVPDEPDGCTAVSMTDS